MLRSRGENYYRGSKKGATATALKPIGSGKKILKRGDCDRSSVDRVVGLFHCYAGLGEFDQICASFRPQRAQLYVRLVFLGKQTVMCQTLRSAQRDGRFS